MTYPIGEYAIGDFPIDLSTPDYFQELLKRPFFDLVYLIEVEPYDATLERTVTGFGCIGANPIGEMDFTYTGATQTYYFSDRGYITGASDTPAHTNYIPSTNNPFQFNVGVFNGDFSGRGGSFGAIRILNGDGGLDYLTTLYWTGRSVKVFAGATDFSREQFVKVFDGLCNSIEHSEGEIIINIQNNDKILDTEFVQSLYGGTGGLDGGGDIEGTPKPLLYGECKRITPVLVDAANLIYQIHDGSIEEITAVYDRGVLLTQQDGDLADITTASVPSGKYMTQLSGGYLRLGSSPDGAVTVDAKGHNSGGYISKTGQIVSHILRNKLGLYSLLETQIDQGSFNRLDQSLPYDVGIYISDKITAQAIFNSMLTPLCAYWTFTSEGLMSVGFGEEPSDPIIEINENDIIDGELQCSNVYTPAWRINVGYARNWTSQNEIATGASDEYRDFAQEEFRQIILETSAIKTVSASSVEKSFNTLILNQADALDLSSKIKTLFGARRKLYTVSIKSIYSTLEIGDTITIKVNRFNLDNGQDFLVVGIGRDVETNTIELELWG